MNGHNQPSNKGALVLSRTIDLGLRTASFALLWWTLNDGDNSAWVLGLAAVIVATALSIAVLPSSGWRLNLTGALRFAAYFLRQALLSSVDVAARVFRPEIPLHPGLVRYPLRLDIPSARVLMANTASLLPGTLSVSLDEAELVVHALDTNAPVLSDLHHLERLIADMYNLKLEAA
ncbi:MAG: Na+/H+ antiporter subunit E [Anaerolineae bacterium]|nr:Na+/H+ antiporter subunit E [Anaerolineae bacterium]MDW8172143.1 Na+/H+ antiporter subunit E [Anaerolineae bacterium]